MIDFNSLKEKMTEEEVKKLDLGLARLRTLIPEAREQILTAMEAMIECENLKSTQSKEKLCSKKLSKSLKSKYDELRIMAKCPEDHKFDELIGMSKILKLGTYEEGAKAIDLLIKINLIKYYMDPEFLIEDIKIEE